MVEPDDEKHFKITLTTVGKLVETCGGEDCFMFEDFPYSKLLVWDNFSMLLSELTEIRLFLFCFEINGF